MPTFRAPRIPEFRAESAATHRREDFLPNAPIRGLSAAASTAFGTKLQSLSVLVCTTTLATNGALLQRGTMLERPKATEGTVSSPLARLIEASHNLIMDRIDLLRVDGQERLEQFIQIGALFLVAALVCIAGWFGLLAAVVLLLDDIVPRWASIGCISVVHLVLGAILVKKGVDLSRMSRSAEGPADVSKQHEGPHSGH